MPTVLNKNDLVKYPVNGGFGFGKVVEVSDKGNMATIELATNATLEKEVKSLVTISEAEYQKSLDDLIGVLNSKSQKQLAKANEDKSMATEIENLKAELVKAQEEIAKMKTEAGLFEQKLTKMEDMRKQADEAKVKAEAELAKEVKARKTEARFNEIKSHKALAAVDKDEAKAKEKLGNMADEAYASVLEMAVAFEKLTDQTQSNLPKATDQTQTSETKVTDAKKSKSDNMETIEGKDTKKSDNDEDDAKADKTADAIKDAKAETDPDLAAAGTAKAPNSLQEAMAKAVNRGRKLKSE